MTAAEVLFTEFKDGGANRVAAIIAHQESETGLIDYKVSQSPDGFLTPDDLKNLGKEVSAFANAIGGVILWGVADKSGSGSGRKGRIKEDRPIPSLSRFVEELNTHVATQVQPVVPGVEVLSIDLGNGCGYAVVYVPQSERKPHMCVSADDKRYYMRNGSSAQKMDHWLVETLMRSATSPKLELSVTLTRFEDHPTRDMRKIVRAFLSLTNIGDVAAKSVAVTLVSEKDRTYRGQIDFQTGALIHSLAEDGSPLHAEQYRFSPGAIMYAREQYHNIEVVQLWEGVDRMRGSVSYRIHADGFSKSGELSILPDVPDAIDRFLKQG